MEVLDPSQRTILHPVHPRFPVAFDQGKLVVHRLAKHADTYPEIKDPCVVAGPAGKYVMYASVGTSVTQQWIVGRFIADHPAGPWTELEPVTFIGINGPQLCAPAVLYEKKDGRDLWTMYVQTACFEENGVIAVAHSHDGRIFSGVTASLITSQTLEKGRHAIVGVYDAGVSEVLQNGQSYLALLFSGYRRVGCGDIYLSLKEKDAADNTWSTAKCILEQEAVPFHNAPDYAHFEWGLEGAKVVQIAPDSYLLIGVCFLPLPQGFNGQRQRVFFASSQSLYGPYTPLGMALPSKAEPGSPRFEGVETGGGEQGHPDTILLDNDLWVLYQQRDGDNKPWYLCGAKYHLPSLVEFFNETDEPEKPESAMQHEAAVR